MEKRELTITNRLGLHARAAAKVVSLCTRHRSRVVLSANGRRADARHFIALLMLSAAMGTRILVEATGPDERQVMTEVARLISGGFGEG